MYRKINVQFDPEFETKVMHLVEVEGVIPKTKQKDRSRSRSGKRGQEIPAYIDDTAQLSFKEELKELGLNKSENAIPDISMISSSSEQKRAHLQRPQ